MPVSSAIAFLPTLLNQLFSLLVRSPSSDVGVNIIRLLVHIVHLVHEADSAEALQTYVKVNSNYLLQKTIINVFKNILNVLIRIIHN